MRIVALPVQKTCVVGRVDDGCIVDLPREEAVDEMADAWKRKARDRADADPPAGGREGGREGGKGGEGGR